jgi:hypothetical protein
MSQFPMSVVGYDTVVQVLNASDTKYQNMNNQRYPYITIDSNTSEVAYFTSSGTSIRFALPVSEKLLDSATLSVVPKEDLTFNLTNDALNIRLVLQSLSIKNPKYTPPANADTKNPVYV